MWSGPAPEHEAGTQESLKFLRRARLEGTRIIHQRRRYGLAARIEPGATVQQRHCDDKRQLREPALSH